MKGVLGNDQWIQRVALVNRVFVIGLKLVECNNLEKKISGTLRKMKKEFSTNKFKELH